MNILQTEPELIDPFHQIDERPRRPRRMHGQRFAIVGKRVLFRRSGTRAVAGRHGLLAFDFDAALPERALLDLARRADRDDLALRP